jgi:hypothetical protein
VGFPGSVRPGGSIRARDGGAIALAARDESRRGKRRIEAVRRSSVDEVEGHAADPAHVWIVRVPAREMLADVALYRMAFNAYWEQGVNFEGPGAPLARHARPGILNRLRKDACLVVAENLAGGAGPFGRPTFHEALEVGR